MKDDPRDVAMGQRIKAMREERGWCLKELASRLRRNQWTIARWETGIGSAPGLVDHMHLAKVFDVTLREIQGRLPETTVSIVSNDEDSYANNGIR